MKHLAPTVLQQVSKTSVYETTNINQTAMKDSSAVKQSHYFNKPALIEERDKSININSDFPSCFTLYILDVHAMVTKWSKIPDVF